MKDLTPWHSVVTASFIRSYSQHPQPCPSHNANHPQMRSSTKRPSDYLKELPSVPASTINDTNVSSLISIELERAAQGKSMPLIETERYNLNPPSSSQGKDNALAWQAAVDNAHAQLEHQKTRLINLELIQKYGSDAWRASNESLASHVAGVQSEAAATTQAVENLNRERKLQQIAAGRELKALEHQYLHLVKKNGEIEAACRAIEEET